MEKINLHIHSDSSLDGSETITKVLDACEKDGITLAAITDHDTCEAYYKLEDTNYTGKLLTGLEADAMIGKKTYDILCYGFELEEVAKWANMQYGTLAYRQQKIFNKLQELCKIIKLPLNNPDSYDARSEFAHAGVFRLLGETVRGQEFLKTYAITSIGDLYRLGTMDETFPLYIDMHLVWPDINELKDVIHRNGGKIFLAHPYRYGKENVETVLDSCLGKVDGIEIWNNPETEAETAFLFNYAKEHNLLMSAGSDYHGKLHPRHNTLSTDLTKEQIEHITTWTDDYKTFKKLPPR